MNGKRVFLGLPKSLVTSDCCLGLSGAVWDQIILLGHLLGHPLGHPLGHLLDHLLDHLIGHLPGHLLGHPLEHLPGHLLGRLLSHLPGHLLGHLKVTSWVISWITRWVTLWVTSWVIWLSTKTLMLLKSWDPQRGDPLSGPKVERTHNKFD